MDTLFGPGPEVNKGLGLEGKSTHKSPLPPVVVLKVGTHTRSWVHILSKELFRSMRGITCQKFQLQYPSKFLLHLLSEEINEYYNVPGWSAPWSQLLKT